MALKYEISYSMLIFSKSFQKSVEETKNALIALRDTTITFSILKETKIGIIVNRCKKKYQESNFEINELCKQLITEWKKAAEPVLQQSSSASSVSVKEVTLAGQGEASIIVAEALVTKTSSVLKDVTASDLPNEVLIKASSDEASASFTTELEEGENEAEELPKARKQVLK
jgi:hypothetical protein